MTALMWAARTGYLAFVVTLAELGANVNAEDFVIFDLLYKRVLAIILTCISSTLFSPCLLRVTGRQHGTHLGGSTRAPGYYNQVS